VLRKPQARRAGAFHDTQRWIESSPLLGRTRILPRPSLAAGCCSALLLLFLGNAGLAEPGPPPPGAPASENPPSGAPTPAEARADELPSETPGLAGRVFRIVRKPLPDLRISQTAIVGSDLGDLGLNTARTTVAAGLAFPVSKRGAIRIRGSGQFAIYEYSGDGLLGPARPSDYSFGDFYSNDWEVIGRYKFSDRWAGVAGMRFGTNVEQGASYTDGIHWGGLVGFGFRSESNLTLVLGVILGTRLDRDGPRVAPLIDFKWQFSERYKLESSGFGMRLTGSVNDRLDLFVSARANGIRYRLASHPLAGPPCGGGDCIPAIDQGSLRDRWVPVLVGADWEFSKHWVLRAHIGAVAYREIKVYDDEGQTVSKRRANGSALVMGLRVRFRI
jgi:hypothetical protein